MNIIQKNSIRIKSLKTYEQFDKGFDVAPETMEELHKKFQLQNAIQTRAVWENENDLSYLKTRMKALIARIQFNNNGYYQEVNKTDATIKKTMDIINSNQYEQIIKGSSPAEKYEASTKLNHSKNR